MKHLLLLGALALLPTVAIAQESGCDRPDVEVAYKGVTLAISPCDGPVQQLVISKTTVEDLIDEGSATARLLTLVANGDTFDVYPTIFNEDATSGIYAGAEVGDTYIVTKKAAE